MPRYGKYFYVKAAAAVRNVVWTFGREPYIRFRTVRTPRAGREKGSVVYYKNENEIIITNAAVVITKLFGHRHIKLNISRFAIWKFLKNRTRSLKDFTKSADESARVLQYRTDLNTGKSLVALRSRHNISDSRIIIAVKWLRIISLLYHRTRFHVIRCDCFCDWNLIPVSREWHSYSRTHFTKAEELIRLGITGLTDRNPTTATCNSRCHNM